MSAQPNFDPTLVEAVTAQLTRSSAAALEARDELMADCSDTGDTPSQQALDTLIDQAAGALEGLSASLTSCAAQVAAIRDADSDTPVSDRRAENCE
jgi:hypothetical protein